MSNLICFGSSSKGNGYAIETEDEILLLECGTPVMEMKKAIKFKISNVVGCLVTHLHLDHSKYVSDYMRNGAKIYSSDEVQSDIELIHGERIIGCQPYKKFNVGGFAVTMFNLHHEVLCVGFYIQHKEIGNMVFITDTSHCEYKFKGLNHILIESNYCDELLPDYVANRKHIMYGHMNIATTKRFVESNNNENLKNVVLLHLSDTNSDEKKFKEQIEEVTNADVYVADVGLKID